ncbi:MAG: hypothetical protein AAFO57_10870, partial [Pseudomonadota bacterium]
VEGWADALVAGLPQIWDPEIGAYDARDLRTGTFAGCLGSGAYLAWLAGIEHPEMEARLTAVWDGVRFGIPSNDPAAQNFNPRRYWRGPTWPVVNSLIAMGFADSGRTAEEARLRQETVDLIEAGGFFEYFDPIDGTPCGGDHFTWTAAIWLAWASPTAVGG